MRAYWDKVNNCIVVDGEGDKLRFFNMQGSAISEWLLKHVIFENFSFSYEDNQVEYVPAKPAIPIHTY